MLMPCPDRHLQLPGAADGLSAAHLHQRIRPSTLPKHNGSQQGRVGLTRSVSLACFIVSVDSSLI